MVAVGVEPAELEDYQRAVRQVLTRDLITASRPRAGVLRGRVVVVHFFAFGCINCIHNYPTYREWQDELVGKEVQLIGIHTPETKSEHSVETLKAKLEAERLRFPVLVDNERGNWNAWGNGMWPSVYVLDKQGHLRTFWAGELKWQGATGDQQIRRKIDELLAEK